MKKTLAVLAALVCLAINCKAFIFFASGGSTVDADHANNIDNGSGTNVVVQGLLSGLFTANQDSFGGSSPLYVGYAGFFPTNDSIMSFPVSGLVLWPQAGYGVTVPNFDGSKTLLRIDDTANVATGLSFVGVVTANAFAGDGSRLTGITYSQISGTPPGGGGSVVTNYTTANFGVLTVSNVLAITTNGCPQPTIAINAPGLLSSATIAGNGVAQHVVLVTSSATQMGNSNYCTVLLPGPILFTNPVTVFAQLEGTNLNSVANNSVQRFLFNCTSNSYSFWTSGISLPNANATYDYRFLVIQNNF